MSDKSNNYEAVQKEYDSFNAHQKDNRGRTTQLVNYAFLLAGGSFTSSVALFASRPKDQMSLVLVNFLHVGWYNLFLATISFFAVVFIMILRDYIYAEACWRPKLSGQLPRIEGKWLSFFQIFFDFSIILAGLFGFATLSYGLYEIMEAACVLVA